MMENQSFDRILGGMTQRYPGLEGVDPDHANWNADYPVTTDTVLQQETRNRTISNDPGHDLDNVLRQIANRNKGFVAEFAQKYPAADRNQHREVPMVSY